MLLTSSQVSVAISSVTVFLFASALFLAGYALQQQTVRDLRAAIKPQVVQHGSGLQVYLPPQFREDEESTKLEVTDTVSQNVITDENGNGDANASRDRIREDAERRYDEEVVSGIRRQETRKLKDQLTLEVRDQEKGSGFKEVADEVEDTGAAPTSNGQRSVEKPQEKLLSRAERRKKIKEQILAEGEGESFKGYRRRAW